MNQLSHLRLPIFISILLIAGTVAKSAPRMPYPPMPALGLLYSESFDEPYEMATNQINSAIWAESWSGWALTREQTTVQPWIIPVLKTNSVFNIDPARGGIRLWV